MNCYSTIKLNVTEVELPCDNMSPFATLPAIWKWGNNPICQFQLKMRDTYLIKCMSDINCIKNYFTNTKMRSSFEDRYYIQLRIRITCTDNNLSSKRTVKIQLNTHNLTKTNQYKTKTWPQSKFNRINLNYKMQITKCQRHKRTSFFRSSSGPTI